MKPSPCALLLAGASVLLLARGSVAATAAAATLGLTAQDLRERGELLLAACAREDSADALRLVDEGADVNFASENGVTPLMRAAAAGLDSVVARLVGLPGGVTKLDRVNMMGNSALILACWNGHVTSALSLVDAGASLDLVNNDDKTALDYAVRSEVPEVVAAIRARGGHARSELKALAAAAAAAAAGGGKAAAAASALATASAAAASAAAASAAVGGASARATRQQIDPARARAMGAQLFAAVSRGDLADTERLITEGAVLDDVGNGQGFTPLMWASFTGLTDIVSRLVEAGAEVNAVDRKHRSALMRSAEGDGEVTKLLLAAGADIDAQDEKGMAALHVACYKGRSEVALILVRAGASINLVDVYGQSPLILAIVSGNGEAANMLLRESGVDLAIVDKHGRTALSFAEQEGMGDVAAAIRARLATPAVVPPATEKGYRGRDLYDAVLSGDVAKALQLIAAGADVDFVGDVAGFTPLMIAASDGMLEVAQRLVRAGASLDELDMAHESALIKACAAGHAELATFLTSSGAAPNIISRSGRTALDHAADKEGFAGVRALLRGRRGALTANELKARAEGGGRGRARATPDDLREL